MFNYTKENWCRGQDCKYHPNPKKFFGLFFLNPKFKKKRCFSCKRYVLHDLYEQEKNEK